MRYDEDHKRRTRQKVLQAAARTIRADGPDRVGVAAIMAEVGLTHGGFYAHFASKEELVAEAIREMFADVSERHQASSEGKPPAVGLRDYVRFYLSRTHRDGRSSGCPLPALSADLPRLSDPAREVFGQGVARLTASIAGQLEAIGWPEPETGASALLSQLVGAVSLARAVADSDQSDRILAVARADVMSRYGIEAAAQRALDA